MKKIKYYGIEIKMSLFDYDNNPALSNKRLYLCHKKKNKRFKNKLEAINFFDKVFN